MSIIDQLQLVTLADICSSEPLYTIEPNATLTEALEKMNENHVTCLPVITTNSITGFFDIRDAMVYLAWGKYKTSGSASSPIPRRDDNVLYGSKEVGSLMGSSDGGQVWRFDGNEPVQRVMEPFSKGIHHAIININGFLRMLSQTDVTRWIATNSAFNSICSKSLAELGLTNGSLITCPDSYTAIEAFRVAAQNTIGAVAIVDQAGRVVGNLSSSDLRGLSADNLRPVEMPVLQYLSKMHPNSLHPVVVRPGDTLKDLLFKVLSHKIHRAWVVKEDGSPTAVITLSDIIGKFTLFSPEIQKHA